VSAVALHHRAAGPAGAPALLLGGSLGTTLEMWSPQLRALADRLCLIAFDHRGHGGSPVPPAPYEIADLGADVLALLDRLGLERASYCGLSIGGIVGIWLAAHAPERIERLVAICTAAHLPPPSAWRERAAAVRAAGSPETVADTVVGRWFTAGFAAAHPDMVARHRAMIAATPAEGYAGCCDALATADLRPALVRISAPTLVIAGAQDLAAPPEHGRRLAEAIAGARFELLQAAAHLASVEQAGEVNRLIAEHVGGGA
jgi:3-oxoadipate enol-lactonase